MKEITIAYQLKKYQEDSNLTKMAEDEEKTDEEAESKEESEEKSEESSEETDEE